MIISRFIDFRQEVLCQQTLRFVELFKPAFAMIPYCSEYGWKVADSESDEESCSRSNNSFILSLEQSEESEKISVTKKDRIIIRYKNINFPIVLVKFQFQK